MSRIYYYFHRLYSRVFLFLRFSFGLTLREIHGLLIICPLMLLWAFFPEISDKISPPRLPENLPVPQILPVSQSLDTVRQLTRKDSTIKPARPSTPIYRARKKPMLDINLADSLDWISLYGIGPVLSSRIMRYRESLGGFTRVEQMKEVYGMDRCLFEEWDRLYVDQSYRITTIPINSASYRELRQHPYISGRQASAIVYYRDQHGKFKDINALYPVVLLDSSAIERLKPYIRFAG